MLRIDPHLLLTTDHYWDGSPRLDPLLRGRVALEQQKEGLRLRASLPHQQAPSIPTEVAGRVANLWEYDVVECFLVGADRYLEVELGPGGHFLVLEFSAPRQRSREYLDFTPEIRRGEEDGRWWSELSIPWEMVPLSLQRINAFTIVGQHFLCAYPTGGEKPNFHQPERFPRVTLGANG